MVVVDEDNHCFQFYWSVLMMPQFSCLINAIITETLEENLFLNNKLWESSHIMTRLTRLVSIFQDS